MPMSGLGERGPIALAEKVLSLLDEGTLTAKYAVLLGLIDLCMENASRMGEAPEMVTTRQLAEKVSEIYWLQRVPFHYESFLEPTILTQNRGAPDTQAAILRHFIGFRREHAPDPSAPLPLARNGAREQFERLVRSVEWKLIQMPLPRVQYFGRTHDEFHYSINGTGLFGRERCPNTSGREAAPSTIASCWSQVSANRWCS